MTATHVFGPGAESWRNTNAPTALIATSLNPQGGAGGQSPETARDLVIMPGTYSGINGYLGARRFMTVRGAPGLPQPVLINSPKLACDYVQDFTVRGLELKNTPIAVPHYGHIGGKLRVEGNYLHSWEREQNGIVNPHNGFDALAETYITGNVFDGVGGKGNTTHSMYIEGRPGTKLVVEDNQFRGARFCSIIKTTCNTVEIRRNTFETRSRLDSTLAAHTMIDVAGCADVIVWDNDFLLTDGLYGAPIFWRLRLPMFGSDRPAYPTISWNPPEAGSGTLEACSSPGGGWGSGPEVFVDDDFWKAVRSFDRADPANPYTFKKWVGNNRFTIPAGNKARAAIRDDGTHPAHAVTQFGQMEVLKTHPLWIERSGTFLSGNTYNGGVLAPALKDSAAVASIEAGALWPRTLPEHFPFVVDVPVVVPQTEAFPPDWFKR